MPLPQGPENATCVCGSTHWHKIIEEAKIFWCQRCGAIRAAFQDQWKIPLDRVGELARSTAMPEEETTRPGTPEARKKAP